MKRELRKKSQTKNPLGFDAVKQRGPYNIVVLSILRVDTI